MARHDGPSRYSVGGIEYGIDLDVLADICEGVEWPDDLAPTHDAARRLLETLGVVGVPVVQLEGTRDCVTPLCVDEALPGMDHCRRHAPIRDLRIGSANSHTPVLTPLEEEAVPEVQTCKIPGCDQPSMWKRGMYAHMCVRHADEKRSGRAAAAQEAKPEEELPAAPAVAPPVVRELEPAGTDDGAESDSSAVELAARPDDHFPETPDNGGGFSLQLALTGDFARDAVRVRSEASKLRSQAQALDVIATGIDKLAETIA